MKMLPLKIASVMLLLLFFSCTEEIPDTPDPVDPNPVDTTAASKNLLTKTVFTRPSGVITKLYQYDAQKRLIWYSNTSTDSAYMNDTSKIVRNGEGHIQQIINWSDIYRDPLIDSVVSNVVYDAAASKYSYKLLQYKSFYRNVKDSTAYAYDAQNKIIKEEAFLFDSTAKMYRLYAKTDFVWDTKGDVTNIKTVYYSRNKPDYAFELVYTYDDKINLLNFGNEAIVLRLEQDFSAHNPAKHVSTYPNPAYNKSLTYVYKYNSKFRPLSADITDAISGVKGTMVYTYE